jgi:hypothetical protein
MCQKAGEIQAYRAYEKAPERTNHVNIHRRLVSPGGRGKSTVGRIHEVDLGEITRPKKNVTGELTHIPD